MERFSPFKLLSNPPIMILYFPILSSLLYFPILWLPDSVAEGALVIARLQMATGSQVPGPGQTVTVGQLEKPTT